jgi:enterochelin esterase family protein
VLYLLHGLFDETHAWVDVGAANVILDNLIADGKATPMLMVNTLGYGNADGPAGHRRVDMLPNFGRIQIEEVLPRVEQRYNVSRQPAGRAIAGLSMGGAEATLVGLNHLDTVGWIGSFSGAYNLWPLTRPADSMDPTAQPPRPGTMPRIELDVAGLPKSYPGLDRSSNAKIRLLWIACGTADVLIGVNRQFKAYLDSKGVAATYTEVPEQGHVWPLWRRNLAEFAPLLFK